MCTIDDVRNDFTTYKKENSESHMQLGYKIELIQAKISSIAVNTKTAATISKTYKWIIGILISILIFVMGEFVTISSSTKTQDMYMVTAQIKLASKTNGLINKTDSLNSVTTQIDDSLRDFYNNIYLAHTIWAKKVFDSSVSSNSRRLDNIEKILKIND